VAAPRAVTPSRRRLRLYFFKTFQEYEAVSV
jgi:hypothetical protein